ncbi:MAG: pilus assembly PilX N-terminal domain-containing protein [Desulfobacterales bacterium]|nr:pilus assembly PilX N-terminal domain-containing protein [Desulfobacterales bacterium]
MQAIRMIYNNEKGFVLPVGLMFLAILALLGTTAVIITTTDLKIGTNYRLSEQALYVAEAGIEEARARLRGNAANPINDEHPTSSQWRAYIGADVKAQGKGWDTGNPMHVKVNSISNLDYVVIINHQTDASGNVLYWYDSDGDGVNEPNITTGENIYLVTSYGYSGASTKIIEVEAAINPGPPIEAALYARGDVTGNGTALSVDGNDNCGAASPKPTIYTLSPSTTILNGTPALSPTGPEDGPIDIDISAAINNLRASATEVITEDESNAIYGDASNFIACYSDTSDPYNVNGLSLSGVTGFGILLIEGDLILGGGFNWNGLILVTGTLVFNGGGLGVNIQGAVLANQTIDINGGVNIKYDSCMVDNSLNNLPLATISWKESY